MEKIELKVNRYLTEQLPYIMKRLETQNIYIEARPGLGKTFLINEVAKKYRVLLVTPMTSTRDGSTSHLGNLKVLETKDISNKKNIDEKSSYAVIWDTFVLMYEHNLLSNFDLIVIDESHKIIQHSSFRESEFGVAQWLTRTRTRFMFMTGTPMGESSIFPNMVYMKITAKEHRDLSMTIVNCENRLLVEDALTAFSKVCLKNNRKVIYFSNSKRAMQDRIVAKLIKDHKIGFYSSSMSDENLKTSLNKEETFSDYEMVCATEYLAEGVNIYLKDDETASVIVTDEKDMNPMLLMQVANRFRDTDIHIYYIHDIRKDDVEKKETLNEKAKKEIRKNKSIEIGHLPEYLLGDLNAIVHDKALVETGYNKYSIDELRASIIQLAEELKKLTHISFFKRYFEAKEYTVNEITWKKEKVRESKKRYDVVPFVANNLRDVLDLISTISLENKIYTKDVILEDRKSRTRIEDGMLKVQNLSLFNAVIRKVKKLRKEGVLLHNISLILKNPKEYGQIDSWYKALDMISTWSEEYEESLSVIKESTAKALVESKVGKELGNLKAQFPNVAKAVIEKEISKVHDMYKLAEKLDVTPQELIYLYNRMRDPNYVVYSYEFELYSNMNDMLEKKNKAKEEHISEIREEAAIKSNNNKKKPCTLYKNGEFVQEFESKTAVYKYLGVNKLKFKNNEATIDGVKYSITTK